MVIFQKAPVTELHEEEAVEYDADALRHEEVGAVLYLVANPVVLRGQAPEEGVTLSLIKNPGTFL